MTTSDHISLAIDLDAAKERYEGMEERLKDLRPVWEYAHRGFVLEEEEAFSTEGAHFGNGEKWAPLSPSYAASKPPVPPPYGILYRTGRMHRSVTNDSDPDNIKIMTASAAMFGTKVEYAKYHQEGTGKMPARVFVKARETYRKLLIRAMATYAVRGQLPTAS